MRYIIIFCFLSVLIGCTTSPSPVAEAETAPPSPSMTAPAPPPDFDAAPPRSDSVPAIPSYAYLTGKFDPADHPAFVKVAGKYTDGDPYLLHRATYAAFERMHAAAEADGVNLIIVSATRNFARQKQIWEAKWRGQRLLEGREKADEVYPDAADRARAILRYSSMPGTSRHHWGTDIDLNQLTNSYFDSGEGKRIYDWLTTHAADYGFCQPYTPKGSARPTGYEEERWHWSYLPLATQLTDYAATQLEDSDISGFDGAEAAGRIAVVREYVLGINPDCKAR